LRQFISAIFILSLGICCLASPQSSPTTAKIGTLRFKGLQHFTETQVLAAIDVRTGAIFDKQQLDAATQRLAQSGAFQEVSYSYRPAGGTVAVEFVVKETTKFHRCTFDNFVWMPENELQSLLRERVPFYDGTAPEAGDILDEISSALENQAKSQHISGTVSHMQYGGLGDTHWEHLFSFAGPTIKVTIVHFTGTHGIEESALIREGKSLIGDYSMVECRAFGRLTFPDYYRERGYLKVEFAEPSAQIAKHIEGSNAFDIQVSYPVKEGLLYQFAGAQWESNTVYTGQNLDGFLGMKAGEVANSKNIEAGWEAIKKEYGKRGYITAELKHNAIFDEANRKVRFQVQVSEGEQYRMGTFALAGFPADLSDKLQSKWQLKAGEVYDASYIDGYLKKELGPALGKFGNKPPKITRKESVNSAQRIVDIALQVE
jgi:outer membrane protein assembly factor BamA